MDLNLSQTKKNDKNWNLVHILTWAYLKKVIFQKSEPEAASHPMDIFAYVLDHFVPICR